MALRDDGKGSKGFTDSREQGGQSGQRDRRRGEREKVAAPWRVSEGTEIRCSVGERKASLARCDSRGWWCLHEN
eukprot:746391-Hanusia_phi.AAC.8